MGKSKKVEEDVDGEEVYHVEVITKARVALDEDSNEGDDGKASKKRGRKKAKVKAKSRARWEYYVKWAGYDSDANSWEPEENVAMCQRLLASFWEHVGTDNMDYQVGYEVEADDKWIKKEKKYFAREFNDHQQELRAQREKAERERSKKRKKKTQTDSFTSELYSSSAARNPIASAGEHDSGEDQVIGKKRKFLENESSSDDQIPLIKLPAPKKLKKTSTSTDIADIVSHEPEQQFDAAEPLFSDTETPLVKKTVKPQPLPPLPKSQPSSAKSTPTVSWKVPQRLNNPHTEIARNLPENLPSGSVLSTKQRLSQGALAPTRPRAVPLPAPKQDHPSGPAKTTSSTLMNLSFKKKPPPMRSVSGSFLTDDSQSSVTPSTSMAREPTLASLNAPLSPVTPIQQIPPETMSSSEFHAEPGFQPASPNLPFSPTLPQRSTERPAAVAPAISPTDRFLQSVMPSTLAAPLTPAIEVPFEPQPPASLLPRKPSIHKVPNKWTWSGSIFVDANLPVPVCSVTFFDATEPAHGGMRFSVALATKKRLDLPGFHDAVDVEHILRACKGVHQFARLGPKDDNDIGFLDVFSTYMAKMKKMILLPISLDGIIVAYIILFHHSTVLVARRFRPPSELQKQGSLVAALVPWSLTSAHLRKHSRKPPGVILPTDTKVEPFITDECRWTQTIRTRPIYQHAIRVLSFPRWLHNYMSEEGRERMFYVWYEGGDGTKKKPGVETRLLLTIMEQCRAKKPRDNLADVRVMFVHVGAVKTLHKLSGFLDFCSVSFHVQFYTYGTHHSVPPMYWGVHEIYPCGGIVTFTPGAILDDPVGVLHRISQIHSHPLWECYILPSALGMAARLHGRKQNEDPLKLFDNGTFPYMRVLSAIDNGEIALITCPPEHELSPTRDRDSRQKWLKSYWTHRSSDLRTTLQSAVEVFDLEYGNVDEADLGPSMHATISKDLTNMRCQPVFMKQYRRYVVVESPKEKRATMQDGLEWTTPSNLDFKDDFFVKQD